jgi:hypothetical protein
VPVDNYDNAVRQFIPGYELLFEYVLALFPPHLTNLLIVGTGTGMELITFGKAHPHWQILGLDPLG